VLPEEQFREQAEGLTTRLRRQIAVNRPRNQALEPADS
jgi:hypothetical protein